MASWSNSSLFILCKSKYHSSNTYVLNVKISGSSAWLCFRITWRELKNKKHQGLRVTLDPLSQNLWVLRVCTSILTKLPDDVMHSEGGNLATCSEVGDEHFLPSTMGGLNENQDFFFCVCGNQLFILLTYFLLCYVNHHTLHHQHLMQCSMIHCLHITFPSSGSWSSLCFIFVRLKMAHIILAT